MVAIYTVFYAGFVAINLISPPTMATIVVAGLNLATVYGMGLIVLAIVQALIYNTMCGRKEKELALLETPSEPAIDTGGGPGTPDGKA
jgi:uncharacterized membrane protein (DUF485 family)